MYVTTDHALSAGDTVQELRDRAEIIDALYRFALGLDLGDRDLAASALAADTELEVLAGGAPQGPVMTGGDTIVDAVMDRLRRLDTTHVVTNPRVQVVGDIAHLTAIVSAQHLLSTDHGKNALLTNRYAVELGRDGERWVMRRVRVDTVWSAGDPAGVLN